MSSKIICQTTKSANTGIRCLAAFGMFQFSPALLGLLPWAILVLMLSYKIPLVGSTVYSLRGKEAACLLTVSLPLDSKAMYLNSVGHSFSSPLSAAEAAGCLPIIYSLLFY